MRLGRSLSLGLLALATITTTPLQAQLSTPLDSALLASLQWRSIGPANMSGRVSDVEGIPSPSKTFYVATAAGGVWKTTNNGTTFRPLFQNERVVAMGDLAIAPSDTMIVWVGTGEEDSRNSISAGGGIYKSTDGGMTWELRGLEATQTIARIVVHPANPDIVYVAALGQIWGANPERGLYRTKDGGVSWELVKFISDKAGFVDLVMHPNDPNTLFAASWERVRGPYFLQSGGPGSALWKSSDGGDSWTEVVGNGFPTAMKGRIGIDISRSNPDIIYAIVEAEEQEDEEGGSGLYRSDDGGATWVKKNSTNVRPFYYSQVRVHPTNPDRVYWSSTPVNVSNDGGETIGNATQGIHLDHHAMWIDPVDPERMIVGNDGGIGVTFDQGGNYIFPNTFAIAQFYAISYDMAVPYNVCGGLQDNGSWCGPSRRRQGGITNAMWHNVGGGDGFYTASDPRDPNIIYVESQRGSMSRMNFATGERSTIRKPNWQEVYTAYADSIILEVGDTAEATEAQMTDRIRDLRARQVADSAAMDLRWNWSTPFFLSPHDPDVFYAAGNRVVKSTYRGDDLQVISPDLTVGDTMKIRVSTSATGGITPDVTGAETHATIVALAESPLRQGALYAGTDDGNVWMSPNDGGEWIELTSRFPGVPEGTWVSRIEPSSHDANRFYVTFDGHRTNDFMPYVYVTEDGGDSFRSISSDLPTGAPDFVHVIREDPVNPDLLFVGTDVGLYVSTDRGGSWQRFMTGLPTVPVHDLKIHPRDRELIAGTHGRAIWIADIAPLQELNDDLVADGFAVFEPTMGFQYGQQPIGGGSTGHLWFQQPSPRYGAEISFWLAERVIGARSEIIITNANGDTVQTLSGTANAGLQTVNWNFQVPPPPRAEISPAARRDSVRSANRLQVIADSLVEAGVATQEEVDRLLTMFQGGNRQGMMGGYGGGGFGGRQAGFRERPAETWPQQRRSAGAGGGMNRELMRAFRNAGGGMGSLFGRGGRGGGGSMAEPGDYTVTVIIGDRVMSKPLTVVRVSGTGGSNSPF